MDAGLVVLLAAVAAWIYAAFMLGRRVERGRHREAGTREPTTTRQLAFISDLADEAGITMPSARSRAEAATTIDDLLKYRRRQDERE